MTAKIVYLPMTTMPPLNSDPTVSIPDPTPDPGHVAGWLTIDVEFADRSRAPLVGAHAVAPVLDALCERHAGQWWFLNQDPGWRVYMHGVPATDVGAANRAARAGHPGHLGR